MKKVGIILGIMMITLLFVPSIALVGADESSGVVPIPGNLLPVPNPSVPPIVPSLPNLGTVSVIPPLIQLYSISQTKSGLVAHDSLDNSTKTQQQLQADQRYWIYGGDAPALNAPYDFFKDGQGLHIGVQSPSDGTWAGYYAVSPNTDAMLFHAVITTPVSTIPSQWYENGLYVQTSHPFINYVACFSSTSMWGTTWSIASVTGNANDGTKFNVLWTDQSANQPLTRDCTIITNGDNYLKAYLDGALVYENNTLNLQMPGPFNAYLEPQSSYSGQLLNGIYKDYYATGTGNVQITNNPVLAATDKIVDPSGKVLASAPVNSGTADLDIGQFHFPLAAYIKVYDSLGNQIASTPNPINMFGGDVYSVNPIL